MFSGDLLTAAVPGVVAAIGVLLQPWFLLFIYLPYGLQWFAPVLTTAITIPIYGLLDRRGTFDHIKPGLKRWKPWRIAWTLAIALCTGVGIVYARYRDFPAITHGLPRPIAAELKSLRLPLQNSNLYNVSDFFDSEYLWKSRLTPPEFEKFKAALGKETKVEPLSRDFVTRSFLEHSPYWWTPELTAKAEVYGNLNFSSPGHGGLFVLLLWIPDRQTAYLWLKQKSSF
jgi:hypothetical protein